MLKFSYRKAGTSKTARAHANDLVADAAKEHLREKTTALASHDNQCVVLLFLGDPEHLFDGMAVGNLNTHIHFRGFLQPSLEAFESLLIRLVELLKAMFQVRRRSASCPGRGAR